MEKITNEVEVTEMKVNKKGFSLVELIVVIAIMAILVGIVGMQVLPYIERSKETKDIELMDTICTAAVSAFTMNADKITAINYVFKDDTLELDPAQEDKGTDVHDTFLEIMGHTGSTSMKTLLMDQLQSKKGKAATAATISFDGTTGVVTVALTGTEGEVLDPVSSRGGSKATGTDDSTD